MRLKKNRPVTHAIFATINLIMASTFALCVTELSVQGRTLMTFDSILEYGYISIFRDLGTAITFQSIAEYYWHRYFESMLTFIWHFVLKDCIDCVRLKNDAYAILLPAVAQVPPSL